MLLPSSRRFEDTFARCSPNVTVVHGDVYHMAFTPLAAAFMCRFETCFPVRDGVRFNVGRTIAFRDHAAADRHFCPRRSCRREGGLEHTIAARARARGFDSVQFTRFVEHDTLKVELLFTRRNVPSSRGGARHGGDECAAGADRFRPPLCGTWPPLPPARRRCVA